MFFPFNLKQRTTIGTTSTLLLTPEITKVVGILSKGPDALRCVLLELEFPINYPIGKKKNNKKNTH